MRDHNIDRLRKNVSQIDWFNLAPRANLSDERYNRFIEGIKNAIAASIPYREVTIRSNDPDIISPLVRLLLKQRCRLLQAGKTSLAEALNTKISCLIKPQQQMKLADLDKAPVAKL